jgi:sigma-B regulation protein RsbU (phosphoserine phosphatase)
MFLMQISPDNLRGMLRFDAISVSLGVVLLVAGLLAALLWANSRRRGFSLLWMSIFVFLYGLRLVARSTTFRLSFDVAPAVWDHIVAAITYTILLPFVLFLRDSVPNWRRVSTWAAVGLTVFAIYAISADAILHRPDSARTPNTLIAITVVAALLGLLFRPGLAPSRELRTQRVGVLSLTLTTVADNLRGMQVIDFPGPNLEPFGFAVLVACFGTPAAMRAFSDLQRLVANDRELAIARQIQSSILPQAMPRVYGLTLAARFRPATAVAGDFYDFLEIDRERMGVLVADVSGHGVPAALNASMVKMALAAQHGRADRPAAVLTGMNETLCGRLAGQPVTAAYLFIDGRAGLIRYAAAGHPPMLHLARRNLEVREVEKNGLILGFAPDTRYEELEEVLEAGDRLLLYTDGLVEATNSSDDVFGVERVMTAVTAGAALPPDAATDALLHTMHGWSGRPAGDDLTIVVVDWLAAV